MCRAGMLVDVDMGERAIQNPRTDLGGGGRDVDGSRTRWTARREGSPGV